MDTDLYEQHLILRDAFKGYVRDNYAESVQPENDHETEWFLARLNYPLYCLVYEKPIPEDCSLMVLTQEFEEAWIQYLED